MASSVPKTPKGFVIYTFSSNDNKAVDVSESAPPSTPASDAGMQRRPTAAPLEKQRPMVAPCPTTAGRCRHECTLAFRDPAGGPWPRTFLMPLPLLLLRLTHPPRP